MAKSRAKTEDSPTVTVKVERGKLVPVSAYDLELISRWREGVVLNVDPVLAMVRPLEKKYWAMLSTLINVAETPWTNTTTAHDALKLATGFITPLKRKDGSWGQRARHLASFTDLELSEYVEAFYGIAQRRFGISAEELEREAPDIGSSGSPSNGAADDGPGADPIPVGAGEPTPSEDPSTDGVPEAGGDPESIPRGEPPAEGLMQVERDWLILTARMLVAASEPGGEVGIVDRQVKGIKAHHTPHDIGRKAKDIAQLIYRYCRTATNFNTPIDRKLIAKMAHCDPADLEVR